jgi:hypothetical protein
MEDGMPKKVPPFVLIFLLCSLAALPFLPGTQDTAPAGEEILAKHLSSAGGEEKLASIKNFSFRTGPLTYYLSPDGRMKITSGEAPVITEVILINKSEAKRNCFNNITELPPLLKATQQTLALLRSGMFTLHNFAGNLEYSGLKKFGVSGYHTFTTQIGGLDVFLYLDQADYLLHRLVIRGFDPGSGTYEINHDYAGFQEYEGIKIPTTWFSSQVGTRGNQFTVSQVKFNQGLEPEFFDDGQVNVGQVKSGAGTLEGNIINVSFRRNMLTLGTNWTGKCFSDSGIADNDKLILTMRDKTFVVDFYAQAAPRSAYQAGSRFVAPNRQDENYIIMMLGPENSTLAEELEPLLPIRIKKQ